MTDVNKAGKLSATGNWITPRARASFVHVLKQAKPMQAGKEPKYQITLLFDKDADFSIAKKMAQDALNEKFGTKLADLTSTDPKKKAAAEAFKARLKNPFRDQGEKAFDGYTPGCIFINATAKQKPGVVDAAGADIIEEKDIYSGCYVRASLRAFAYDVDGGVGVAFGLQNVQKLADGEPLGGRSRPQDDFEPVADAGGTTAGASADSLFG
jgi:hypothetical protein